MNADEIPINVWKWISRRKAPIILIITPHPLGTKMYLEDDPELAEAMSQAYHEFMRKRHLKKIKEKKQEV